MSTNDNNNLDMVEDVVKTEQSEASDTIKCAKCGSPLTTGQLYCPSCGYKAGSRPKQRRLSGKTIVLIIIIAILVVAAVSVGVVIYRNNNKTIKPREITLNKTTVTIKVGESVRLKYTINPEDSDDTTVTWTSSNESIATVNRGNVTGVNEGDCVITVATSNGKTDTCEIIVEKAGPDFEYIFNAYCDPSYASVASDGSYLSIDTNPNDIEEYDDYDAINAILSVNDCLGIPESVVEQMSRTRALDGIQSAIVGDIEISWSYHPDNGLEVLYCLVN